MTEAIPQRRKPGRKPQVRDLAWLRERVKADSATGCWIWTQSRGPRGYGRYGMRAYVGGPMVNASAHRLALELILGRPIQPGMHACHRCDNPPCCNPQHLFEGTTTDNQRDCREKGRARWRTGEQHGMAKLTAVDVFAILDAIAAGETQGSLAKRYGVCQATISNVRTGKTHGAHRAK